MKKFILSLVLCCAICGNNVVFSNEIEEDYLDIAANYCVVGDYDSAMNYLDKILKINPSNKKVADLKRGLSHVINQDKKTFVTSVNPLIKQSMEAKKNGNINDEISLLTKATQQQNAYLAFYHLGNYYRENNNYIKAIDAYNNALSARPDFAQAYLASAITLFDMGRYQAVINPIDKYLTFEPNDDLAYAIKSRAQFQLGMLEDSKTTNDKAIFLNDCPEYQFDRAKILFKSGEFKSSKELFTKLLSHIQTSKIYEYMSYCDYEMKDYLNALINLDKAILLSNDDEYLETRYNEVKSLLEKNQNE